MNMKKGLTFDDLLLVPRYSDILPKDVILKTKLINGLFLKQEEYLMILMENIFLICKCILSINK